MAIVIQIAAKMKAMAIGGKAIALVSAPGRMQFVNT
jgi:hypothetical protein